MNSLNGLQLTAAAMRAQEALLDLTAQNLANAGTPGYKPVEMVLRTSGAVAVSRVDYASGTISQPLGELALVPLMEGTASRLQPGPMQATGQPLEVAIDGAGMFVVQGPDGLRYTRRGDFRQDAGGRLVTAEGYPVLVGGAPVGRPSAQVRIDEQGLVRVDDQPAGFLDVLDVDRGGSLRRAGGVYWLPPAGAAGAAPPLQSPGSFRLRPGALEQAAVDPLREMVNLMTAVRTYEMNQRVLQAQDEALGRAAAELARF